VSDAAEQLHRVADRFAKESQPTHFLFWCAPSLANPVSSLKDRCFASLPLDPATKLVLATRFGDHQFQLELPGRYFGLAQDNISVFAYLIWIGPRGLWQELFSLAAGVFTQGRQRDPEFWLRRLVEEAFFNPGDPMVRFSSGPSIMDNDQMFDLWAVLEGLSGAINLPEDLAAQIGALPIPWILRAEHARPFMASEFLCRRYADRLQQKAASQGGGAAEPKRPEAAFVFRNEGSLWFIRAFGKEGHFPDMKGFQYIARLIEQRGARLPLPHLLLPSRHATLAEIGTVFEAPDEDDPTGKPRIVLYPQTKPHQDQLADGKTIQGYIKALKEYDAMIQDAQRRCDETVIQNLRKEAKMVQQFLREAVSPKKQRRFFRGSFTSARTSVANALARAYAKLRQAGMSELASHFQVFITWESYGYAYRPDPPIVWDCQLLSRQM
jgi:hypothetical protein